MKSEYINQVLANCRLYADKVAIVDNDGSRNTTYMELYQLAMKVSDYIGHQLISEHSFISVKMPNCMEYMAAELGIWLANCAAVPLGMNSPEERTATIMQDCDSPLLIDIDLMGKISNMPANVSVEPNVPEQSDDALLIYTSGSTGKPKGILHTFRSFINLFHHNDVSLISSPEQVFGCAAAFYFGAIAIAYDRLRDGATIHLYSDHVKSDPRALDEYIKKHNISVSHISPGVLAHFHNTSDSLKVVVTAGERLTTQYSKEGYILYNYLGLSETLGGVTYYRVDDHPMETVPLGHANDWVEYRIMKEDGSLAKIGEDGELCIRGNFCKCYYKDPERTAQLYQNGWLHTRDIVMQGEDGLLYYRNRKDWMVKVNGQRVEPGEVENAIRKMEEVSDVIVKGFDNGRGSQYLCAFYIAADDVSQQQFSTFLNELIPPYMHPAIYVRMESFPVNANGKINRLALEAPDLNSVMAEAEPPKSDREFALLNIAQEILGNSNFGVTDNLYELGMDSICAAQLVAMAAEKNYTIKAIDVANHPTIRELAECSMSLLYWFEPYNEEKPILVFACGAIGVRMLERRMKSFAKHYNVLVVEAYYEHYTYIASSGERFEDVIGLYYDIFDLMVEDKTKVVGFIGFSFGGTVAYGLCRMFYQQTGLVGNLILGDSPLVFDHHTAVSQEEIEKEVRDIAAVTPEETLTSVRIFHYGMHSILNLMSEWSATPIPANVLFFHANDCTEKNLQKLHECFDTVTIFDIDDDHLPFVLDRTHNWCELTVTTTLGFLNKTSV